MKTIDLGRVSQRFLERGWEVTAEEYLSRAKGGGGVTPLEAISSRDGASRVRLYTLADIVITNPGGLLISADHEILRESVFYDGIQVNPGLRGNLRFGPTEMLPGACVPLNGVWSEYFWHWLYEYLPRVLFAQLIELDPIYLLPPQPNPYMVPSLRMLGVRPERMIISNAPFVWAERVVIPERLAASAELLNYPVVAQLLRERMLSALKELDALEAVPRRVYISRQRSTRARRVLNGVELEELLARFAFETVYLEELPFEEQLRKLAMTTAVVGAHGAGFAQTVFMPEGSLVVELFSPYFAHTNSPLANEICKHRYYQVCGTPTQAEPPTTGQLANLCDIQTDLALVEEILAHELMPARSLSPSPAAVLTGTTSQPPRIVDSD